MSRIGVVAIGRNEGERLRACLESVRGVALPVVYVDSGSTDRSVEIARLMGAEIVELDMSRPFSAARARNAGVERLIVRWPAVEFVQFLDGDCLLVKDWPGLALATLDARPEVAVACGNRRESFPEASIYNRMCDLEWNGQAGEVEACGGDSLMRVSVFRSTGGFDPSVLAGEEPELCDRVRRQGAKILRLDADMTFHDVAMTRFGQWWRRQVRTGCGSMDVARRFGLPAFSKLCISARVWAVGWPLSLLVVSGLCGVYYGRPAAILAAAIVMAVLPVQAIRIARGVAGRTGWRFGLVYGLLTMAGKFGQFAGQLRYLWDRAARRPQVLIEYKQPEVRALPGPVDVRKGTDII